jgi:DNA topoisomerase-1
MPAGLQYVSDDEPGIRRRGRTRFSYVDERTGEAVRDREVLARIRSLAVPPAWTDVWICPDEPGHIQATGRDARGRKQYRYHDAWRTHRDETKFDQLVPFGNALGSVRSTIDADLDRPGLPFERVVALVVGLLDETAMRVGNEEYARENGTYGLTTLRNRHARVEGSRLRLRFKGKNETVFDIACTDRRICKLIGKCQELPGQLLFQYVDDDGEVRRVRSSDVNLYLQESSGLATVTAKTFRTWSASVLAADALARVEVPEAERERARVLNEVVDGVATRLGNTRAVCRASYIHPTVIETWEADGLGERWRSGPARPAGGLLTEERRLLHVLDPRARRRRMRRAA